MKYYIERKASGYCGNNLLFWRKGGAGYGCDISEAEVFDDTDPKFLQIIKDSKYRAWPKEHIDSTSMPVSDHQRLNYDIAIWNGQREKKGL